jgi:hypothetical protein
LWCIESEHKFLANDDILASVNLWCIESEHMF